MKRFKSCRAYGAFEYVIVAALIALVAILVLNLVKGMQGENNIGLEATEIATDSLREELRQVSVKPSGPGNEELIDTSVEMSNDPLAAFLMIAKYSGAEALSIEGGSAFYESWKNSTGDMYLELEGIQRNSEGYLLVGETLYNSIFGFVSSKSDGAHTENMPSVGSSGFSLGSNLLPDVSDYSVQYSLSSHELFYSNYKSTNVEIKVNTPAGLVGLAGTGVRHYHVFGPAYLNIIYHSSTNNFEVGVSYFYNDGTSGYARRILHSRDNWIFADLMTPVTAYTISNSTAIPWDSPFWNNKKSGSNILIPNMPGYFLSGENLPSEYNKVLSRDYNKNLHAMYFWNSLK